jgi:hypothetical protein
VVDAVAQVGGDVQAQVLGVPRRRAVQDRQGGGAVEGRHVQDRQQVGETGQQPPAGQRSDARACDSVLRNSAAMRLDEA